ncbi:hypothetical protein BDN70DRAFT_841191 [Pholiota conissans]|uniref:F-box domain-containing protein n=1 Tax=Pholiota conissans TaxID=109636 RepID=A0A9P5YWP8_9AGAR|nr:hypothetical protein BDN70DRAFT_841191 [Pholiota conissans]
MDDDVRGLLLSNNFGIEERMRIVDEKIDRHHASISALKSYRNTLAPIARLPPEVLCYIFRMLKNKQQSKSRRKTRLKWIRWTTHVCRHWRDVAINFPGLWIDPPSHNYSCVEVMLQRSQDASLIIEWDTKTSWAILELALQHIHRIKDLTLYLQTLRMWEKVQERFMKAPRLESLSLSLQRHHSERDVFSSKDIVCDTPKLRRMAITDSDIISLNNFSHLFRGLTYLKLGRIIQNSQMTWSLLADVFEAMPDLEFLHLGRVLPISSTADQISSRPQIQFRSLQSIEVGGRFDEIETLFALITFPSTAKMAVRSFSKGASKPFFVLLARFAQIYSNLPPPQSDFKTLILLNHPSSDRGFRVKLVVDELTHARAFRSEQIFPHLDLSFAWSNGSNQSVLQSAMNAFINCGLHLQCINHIVVDVTSLTPQTLADTIGKLNQVRSITTRLRAGGKVVHALKYSSVKQNATVVTPTYFARLSSIFLCNLNIMSRLINSSSLYPNTSLLDILHTYLAWRSSSNARLEKVTLKDCGGVTLDRIDLLKKVVDRVECLDSDEESSDSNSAESDPSSESDSDSSDSYNSSDSSDSSDSSNSSDSSESE